MNVVYSRQNGPHAVDLTPVPVDLGDDEEDWEEREREGEARDNRVGRDIDVFQSLKVANVGEDLLRQRVELRDIRLDGCAVRSAVGECLDQGHGDPGWRSDEHAGGIGQWVWGVRARCMNASVDANSCSIECSFWWWQMRR